MFPAILRKMKDLLQRKKVKDYIFILPSPHLNLLSQYLLSLQKEDGSWFHEPLNTSIILQALHTYFQNRSPDFQKTLKTSVKYLESELKKLIHDIVSSEDLYPQLDQKALLFGNIFYTLGIIHALKLEEEVIPAFRKLELEIIKYCYALNNVEVISAILKCYSLPFMNKPPNELIRFLLNVCLTRESARDSFIALNTLNILQEKYLEIIERVWRKEAQRYDQWKDTKYQEIINEIAQAKLKLLTDKEEIETLAYGFMVANKLNSDSTIDISKLLFRKLDSVWNKIFQGKTNEIEVILSKISLALIALSSSPFRESFLVTSPKLKKVHEALNWYEEKLRKGIIPLTVRRYNVLLFSCIILSVALIFSITYILFKELFWGMVVSLLTEIVLLILGRFLKKPPLERG